MFEPHGYRFHAVWVLMIILDINMTDYDRFLSLAHVMTWRIDVQTLFFVTRHGTTFLDTLTEAFHSQSEMTSLYGLGLASAPDTIDIIAWLHLHLYTHTVTMFHGTQHDQLAMCLHFVTYSAQQKLHPIPSQSEKTP